MNQLFVVCICPTKAGRLDYLRHAIRYFAEQTYPHRELLILTDTHDEGRQVRAMVEDERVVTMALEQRASIGQKRNILCDQAREGCIICHWDDDDWYGPNRIAEQVAVIESGALMTGYSHMWFADDEQQQAWRYTGGNRCYVIGVSLMYRRERWKQFPFEPKSDGEDNDFIASSTKGLVAQNFHSIIARIHAGNTMPKKIRDMTVWNKEPWEEVLRLGYQPTAASVTA